MLYEAGFAALQLSPQETMPTGAAYGERLETLRALRAGFEDVGPVVRMRQAS